MTDYTLERLEEWVAALKKQSDWIGPRLEGYAKAWREDKKDYEAALHRLDIYINYFLERDEKETPDR